jgi:hypothetical protein
MTALDLLGKARELGVRVVQIGPNLPLDQLSEAEREAIVRQAREGQLELEIGTRGLETDHLRRYRVESGHSEKRSRNIYKKKELVRESRNLIDGK